jgi:GNAT superfamily N-acetyltransferase
MGSSRAGLADRVREFLDAARVRGAAWALRGLWSRYGVSCRRAYLFWHPVVVSADPPADEGFTYRLATIDDLDRLAVFEPYVTRTRMRRWLTSADTWVLVAYDGDQPVAFECDTTSLPPDPILPVRVLASHQVWVTDIYIVPHYRGRGVSHRMRERRTRLAHARGFTELGSKVDEDNAVSLRRTSALPGRVQHVTLLSALGLRRRRVVEDARALLAEHLAQLGDTRPLQRRGDAGDARR